MFVGRMATNDGSVRLVEPDVERDAPLGLQWLAGEAGRETLRLMGVTNATNHPPTLEQERQRIQDFIDKSDQLNWMIAKDERIIGSVWADLEPTEYLKAPSLHIMIGDPTARGQGAGSQAFRTVAKYLADERHESAIYTRHLLGNIGSAKLAATSGFHEDGAPYEDADGLHWQNRRCDPAE
jgi:RimJ/RimL family protein N-acetyltransferase